MQRKAVSQQTEMSRPRFYARWRRSAQRSLEAGAFTLALRASVVDGMRTAPHVALPFDTILRRAAVPSGPFR